MFLIISFQSIVTDLRLNKNKKILELDHVKRESIEVQITQK